MSKTTQHKKEHPARESHEAAGKDELIVVPKGRSRLAFFFTTGVIMFVLLVFMVTDEMFRACSRVERTGTGTYMSWNRPGHGVEEMSAADFVLEKRKLSMLRGGRRADVDDDQVAFWLVLDTVAADSGIAVTDTELNEWILRVFGTPETYRQYLKTYGETPKAFETTLRRDLRVQRYVKMVDQAAGLYDPEEIDRRWKGRHQQYEFDYVSIPVEPLVAEARAQLPDEAGLRAWFDGLSEQDRARYRMPAEMKAELAYLPLDGPIEAPLLKEKFPGQPPADAEAHAQEYYQGFSYVRYRREKPDLSQGITPATLYQPYDEVRDTVLAEVGVYDSITEWLKSLSTRRDAGETIDFAQEAAAVGLAYEPATELLTADEWDALERPWAGDYVSQALAATEPGQFFAAPLVEHKAFVVARVLEKLPERSPTFEEVRERAGVDWVADRAGQMAREKLEALRDELGQRPAAGDPSPFRPEVDAEKFASVASAHGYTVEKREWHERVPAKTDAEPTETDRFFRASGQLYALRVASVPDVLLDAEKKHAYLVRVAGIRDPEGVTMEPAEFEQLRAAQQRESLMSFQQRVFGSRAFMQETYGLQLKSWQEGS